MHWAERWVPGIVGLAIVGVPTIAALRELLRCYQSRHWKEAEGKIVSSQRRTVWSQRGGTGLAADIRYSFQVDGREYQGSRVLFGGGFTTNVAIATDRLREYPVGKSVTVHYCPADPSQCTLLTKASWHLKLGAILGITLAALLVHAIATGT